MAKDIQYQLHLKGYVGGYDFDADYVDYILAKNTGKEVHVLIDSLGGQSNTALSIFSAFKRHGNVYVHFVGMNASAATIASLGAKRISMDSSAMYLVHKCSIAFFEWGNMNADDLSSLITNIEHQKKDLDKLDANIAQMYATRCKRSSAELLNLMKQGGWLTAAEALEWGFVDELTDYDNETAPILNDNTIKALSSAGIPIPDLPKNTDVSAFYRFLNALTGLFKSQNDFVKQSEMKKIFSLICNILAVDSLSGRDGKFSLDDGQLTAIESALENDKQSIQSLTDRISTLENEKKTLADEKSSLQKQLADMKTKPAADTAQVVSDAHNDERSEVDAYIVNRSQAQSLFDMLP